METQPPVVLGATPAPLSEAPAGALLPPETIAMPDAAPAPAETAEAQNPLRRVASTLGRVARTAHERASTATTLAMSRVGSPERTSPTPGPEATTPAAATESTGRGRRFLNRTGEALAGGLIFAEVGAIALGVGMKIFGARHGIDMGGGGSAQAHNVIDNLPGNHSGGSSAPAETLAVNPPTQMGSKTRAAVEAAVIGGAVPGARAVHHVWRRSGQRRDTAVRNTRPATHEVTDLSGVPQTITIASRDENLRRRYEYGRAGAANRLATSRTGATVDPIMRNVVERQPLGMDFDPSRKAKYTVGPPAPTTRLHPDYWSNRPSGRVRRGLGRLFR